MLGIIIGGAIIAGVGGAMARRQQREQARKEAEYQKKLAEERRKTALGTMENNMIGEMEKTYSDAYDAGVDMKTSATAASYSTFLGEKAAEAQYLKDVASATEASGGADAAMGASGAKADVNLQTVINAQITQDLATERQGIDGSRTSGIYAMTKQAEKYKTAIGRAETAFDEGSTIMRSYQWNRDRVNVETDITVDYLNQVIHDNQYNGDWFAADILGFASAGFGGAQTYALTK